MRKWASRIGLGLAVVVAAAAAGSVVATVLFARGDRICRGVTIAGIRVGGLTRGQALNVVCEWSRLREHQPITISALDVRQTLTLADLGAAVRRRESVDQAFTVGRTGNLIERAVCLLSPGGRAKRIEAKLDVDTRRMAGAVSRFARMANRPHVDARTRVVDGRLEIEQDAFGIKVDEQRAVALLRAAIAGGGSAIALPVETDEPEVKASDATRISAALSGFTTWYNAGQRNRTHNLVLAANCINGVILKPGQRFSYNSIVGPRVTERGFKDAPIFIKGKLEPGIGGGVCQVSSTLYNSVLLAGLKVHERSNHSQKVPYVVPGRDATVVYGRRDFVFENSNSSPICIVSQAKRCRLSIDIYGAPEDKKCVTVFTSRVRRSAPKQQAAADSQLKPVANKAAGSGPTRIGVTVYRKTVRPDGTTVTEVVSRDSYLPAQKKITHQANSSKPPQAAPAVPVAASKPDTDTLKTRAD